MAFDEDQPRDDKGQWTSGDAGDAIKDAASDGLKFKDERLIINGDDFGVLKLTKHPDGNIEIDKLYLNKEKQKSGIGRKVMGKIFNDNPKAKKILVYPLASSEPYWLRFADNVQQDGTIEITRQSFEDGKKKHFK